MDKTSEIVEPTALPDPFTRGVISGDIRTVSYRVALATPRMAQWAQGAKVTIRAGLYVSRAKSLAAWALYLGISSQSALDVVKQLNAADPSRADYRRFIESVEVLLAEVARYFESENGKEGIL